MNTAYRLVHLFRQENGSYETITGIPFSQDLQTCLALAHGSAYGNSLDRFIGEMWKPLLSERRIVLAIIEEREEATVKTEFGPKQMLRSRPVGFRFFCFVSEAFDADVRAQMQAGTLKPPLSAYLAEQHAMGRSPILNRKEVAKANAAETLIAYALTIHDNIIFSEELRGERVQHYSMATMKASDDMARGYSKQSVFLDGYGLAGKAYTQAVGMKIISDFQRYYQAHHEIHEDNRHWVAYVHRDDLPNVFGSTIYTVATFIHPVLNLSPTLRETLELTLEGANESVLMKHYCVTKNTMIDRFREIYRRVNAKPPKDLENKHIGKDTLLEYLKTHPEEIRPHAKIKTS